MKNTDDWTELEKLLGKRVRIFSVVDPKNFGEIGKVVDVFFETDPDNLDSEIGGVVVEMDKFTREVGYLYDIELVNGI